MSRLHLDLSVSVVFYETMNNMMLACIFIYCYLIFLAVKMTLQMETSTIFSSPEPFGSQGELRHRSSILLRPPFSKIFSKTTWPIAKLHMEPLWKEGTKVCINDPGHMTKLAAKPIYGENLKNHDDETSMQHWGIKVYKGCINDDPGLTLTYFTARSNWVSYAFEWGKLLVI